MMQVMIPNKGEYSISTPADLYDHVAHAWDAVVEENQAGLVDAKHSLQSSAPLTSQEAWHHFQASRAGVVDSARFLITFGVVPSIQSGGKPIHSGSPK